MPVCQLPDAGSVGHAGDAAGVAVCHARINRAPAVARPKIAAKNEYLCLYKARKLRALKRNAGRIPHLIRAWTFTPPGGDHSARFFALSRRVALRPESDGT
jgi:hypothetical protein